MSKKTNEPQPMDATIREQATGTTASNSQRVCWAIKTLVAEVHELFPETPVEYSNYNGRNTALDVTFNSTSQFPEDEENFTNLLMLTKTDERVAEVISEDAQVLVSMRADARTQDSRESFGLAEAWEVLTEGDTTDDSGTWGGWDGHAEPTSLAARGLPGSPTYFGGSW